MKMPQLIRADDLIDSWPMVNINTPTTTFSNPWVLARPIARTNLITRIRLAIGVFTGEYDALEWEIK